MRRRETQSKKLFHDAQKLLAGGVNSPVRSFKSVGRENPLFISRAKGSKIYDADGNEYIDYVCSWGASILGSAHPAVVKKVQAAASRGLSFGAATSLEVSLAEEIKKRFPSMELMRLVSSGTEAAMSAVRVARAFTKREKIVKFDGCYHGHSDTFLVRGGSGLATLSIADSAGISECVGRDTLVARFNDLASVEALVQNNRDQVAAVIVEPIAGNMGVIPPSDGFLEGLRALCDGNGILLIFDEVITGFRVSSGGAQALYDVVPDLTCLGKVVGGGMNIAAYGGRNDVMQMVSPLGPVYQAGTLAGNPVAVASGIATLDALDSSSYSKLETRSKELADGLERCAGQSGVAVRINRVGSMIGLFFTNNKQVLNYDDVKNCDKESYVRFFNSMLEGGIYLPPSPFETIFVSTAHSNSDISRTVARANGAFRSIRGAGSR